MSKALFFDIDGTLVSFKTHTIPQSACNALKQLKANGHKIFIATGRPRLLLNNLEYLNFDGFITMNGAHCFTADYTDIFKGSIPPDDIERLISYYTTHDYPFICILNNEWFITHSNTDVEEVCSFIKIKIPPIAPIETARGKGIMEIMGYFPQSAEKEIFENVLTHCEARRWHPLFSDIVTKGISKSMGIDKIIQHFGIHPTETIAFGDGKNDISMLIHSNIGIAMGNADDKVKAAANYITDSVDEDGIEKALKRLNLI